MRIERLSNCCGSRGNLSAVDFQPCSNQNTTQRIATSGGTYVQIWSLSKGEEGIQPVPVKCVLLYTFKDHSPYDVMTVRWSPNGQYLASTDSGGITNIYKRNDKKTEIMEKVVKSKLSGQPSEIPMTFTESKQVKKYTIKYDGTDKSVNTSSGVPRISINPKNVQIESKEVKMDNFNLLSHDNLEGNLESWYTFAKFSCPHNMGQLFDISWAPDNRSIIGGGMNGQVIVFDIHTKEIVAKFDALEKSSDTSSGRGYIKSVSWDPMTLFVAVQSSNKEISIWRRSPPLPPGSPMKWTFKRVLHQNDFSEKTNTDVLGGSRMSWAPNGKNVVFPNSSSDNYNFSTCFQINHNISCYSHIFNKSNYDKNTAQYYFDTSEHEVDDEPILLKGHNTRIRNVRFSEDIMKPIHDVQNNVRYLLLAQSSDDNMLSFWRFKLNSNSIVDVECICVINNLLDEQSSIEDLSWGDFGRSLAVASSQGGLILIQFTYEEMGVKFHSNRIIGLNLAEMKQPSPEFFTYSEYVNNISDEPLEQPSAGVNVNSNHNLNNKSKTLTEFSENRQIDVNGYITNLIFNWNKNEQNYNTHLLKIFCEFSYSMCMLLFYYYRSYLYALNFNYNENTIFAPRKRSITPSDIYNVKYYDTFYLFNFTIESESKINQTKRRNKTKKQKTTQIMEDIIKDVWLDMDYTSENTLVTNYWNNIEETVEVPLENETNNANLSPLNSNSKTGTPVAKIDKQTKNTSKYSRSEKSKLNRSDSSNSLNLDLSRKFSDYNSILTFPVVKSKMCFSVDSKKILVINFLNTTSETMSSVTCVNESDYKIKWLQYLKSGYITHIDYFGDFLVVLTQKIEEKCMVSVTIFDTNEGIFMMNESELGDEPVCLFSTLRWTGTYFLFLTTTLQLRILEYHFPNNLTVFSEFSLKDIQSEEIQKIELLNTTKNYERIMNQKLKHNEECLFRSNVKSSLENIVAIVYKKNKNVSIFVKGYKELELNLDHMALNNNSIQEELNNFTLDSLVRMFKEDFNNGLYGHIQFDGSLSSIIETLSTDYNVIKETESNCDVLQDLKMRLLTCLSIGSVWEYLLYLYEYYNELFKSMELASVLELTSGLYKSLLGYLKETAESETLKTLEIYDFTKYFNIAPYCLLLVRQVVMPNLNIIYKFLNPGMELNSQNFEDLLELSGKCSCLNIKAFNTFSPRLDYSPEDAACLSEKLLEFFKDVRMWENSLEF
uniref:Protein HIRA n=1 Tax=Theileria annulata TaxID=5874 RepID=A0A3B0MNP3_THEAN